MELPHIRPAHTAQTNAHDSTPQRTQTTTHRTLPSLVRTRSNAPGSLYGSRSSLLSNGSSPIEAVPPVIAHISRSHPSAINVNGLSEPLSIEEMVKKLTLASHNPFTVSEHVPFAIVHAILSHVKTIFHDESNIVETNIEKGVENLTIVADLHGQLFDLLQIFQTRGFPSAKRPFVFLGDYVDRGLWGFEVAILLFLLKIQHPEHVVLLRGNHESRECTALYGFMEEIEIKYSQEVYENFVQVFDELPLGCLITGASSEKAALAVHGGLFRRPFTQQMGDIPDLMMVDRVGEPRQRTIEDVLWSDPMSNEGIRPNHRRQKGLHFGPRATQRFLRENKLCLLIRGHESPKSRINRKGLKAMPKGYAVDHCGTNGAIVTLSSTTNAGPAAYLVMDACLNYSAKSIHPTTERKTAEAAFRSCAE